MNDDETKRANVLKGRANKASGAKFELWLEYQHITALQLGILAHIEKTEPRATFVKGKLIYTAKSCADFVGVLDRCGTTIAIEAKSTKDRFYKSEVSDKQQDHLSRVAHAGGIALLAIEFRDKLISMPLRFAIPWLSVPWRVAKTSESLTLEGLLKWPSIPETETCYLRQFHSIGPSSTPTKRRAFARE